MSDVALFVAAMCGPRAALVAENLFLRKQLALYIERQAKPQRAFVCQSCGTAHPRWAGRCDECGAWNSLTEETAASPAPAAGGKARGRSLELVPLTGTGEPPARLPSGIDELDRGPGTGGPRPDHRSEYRCQPGVRTAHA